MIRKELILCKTRPLNKINQQNNCNFIRQYRKLLVSLFCLIDFHLLYLTFKKCSCLDLIKVNNFLIALFYWLNVCVKIFCLKKSNDFKNNTVGPANQIFMKKLHFKELNIKSRKFLSTPRERVDDTTHKNRPERIKQTIQRVIFFVFCFIFYLFFFFVLFCFLFFRFFLFFLQRVMFSICTKL